MLGSFDDAEDMVQETMLRLAGTQWLSRSIARQDLAVPHRDECVPECHRADSAPRDAAGCRAAGYGPDGRFGSS